MKLAVLAPLAAGAMAANGGSGPSPAAGAGERAYRKCYSCHAVERGRNDLAGPSLNGIIGRPVAAVPGFAYSPALRRFARANPRWNRQLVDRYAADPEALVPGTSMAFHGMPDAKERQALLDYLASLGN